MKNISKVFLQDCSVGMKSYEDNYFDWAICDVPYGIGAGKMNYLKQGQLNCKQTNGSVLRVKNRNRKLKDWDTNPPPQSYFDELIRVSRNQIIFGVEYVDWYGLGNGRIKWNKGVPKGVSFKGYELAYCSMISGTIELNLLWAGMMQAKSLSEPMRQQGNKKLNEKRIHPCHKPRLLYKKLLLDYIPRGSKIIDTHVGGGSLRIEADLHGCDFIGYEIDLDYWTDQEKRYKDYAQQLRLF